MHESKSVAQSVRDEVDRHRRQVLKLEESAVRIAGDHKIPDRSLVRLALLHMSREQRGVVKL